MQIVDRPSLYTRQHCLDRTSVFASSLLPLCSARHVPAQPCRAILPKGRRRRRGAASCRNSASSLSDLSVTPQAAGLAASQLVQSLAEDLDSLKQRPLSPACSLSIYRLTKLCTTSQGPEVALALTLDGRLHNGKGVFLHIVQLLQQDGDASSQSLAADLIQAMLSDDWIALEDVLFASTLGLPNLHHSFDCNRLLEVISSSNRLKVKTSAVLVLLLIAVEDSDGHHKVSESGAVVVTLLEMLSVAGSWPAFSANQRPGQPSDAAGVHTVSEAETAQTVPPEVKASSPFMAACNTLLYCLVYRSMQEGVSNLAQVSAFQRKLISSDLAMMAFAVGTCNWQAAQQSPAKMSLPLAGVVRWWRRREMLLTPTGWSFFWLVHKTVLSVGDEPKMSASRMLWLADRIRRQRQAAQHMIEGSEAVGLEEVVSWVTGTVLRVENDRCIGLGQQVERDALVRTITPSLLALLQHPVEDKRAFAAKHACLLAAASNVGISALLSSSNGLSTLLTRLAGDDTPESRSIYARLIADCTPHCNAAALKKISESGAVPYLLQLLREADGWRQQYNAVQCLEGLAKASKEIATSMVVHGGTQQLLDLVHAGIRKGNNGRVQLDKETQHLTHSSIETLGRMMHVPAAAADIMQIDLAGLVLQILQGPFSEPFHVTAANSLYLFSRQPASRQQLLEKLTPDSTKVLVDLSLKLLEAPDYDESALIIVADLLGLLGEVTAGRQQLALPSIASRLSAVLDHASTTDSPGYNQAQGYVLPTLALLSYLKRDGSYHYNPWLIQPTPTPQATDSRRHQIPDQAPQPSPHDSQPSSESDSQQLLAAASARLSQSSAAELAHATPSHGSHGAAELSHATPVQDATSADATSTDATSQQTQSLSSLVEELKAHQQWQETLVQSAAALVSDSPFPRSRFQGMTWLMKLVPQLTEQGCMAIAHSGAVMASVSVIQRESEPMQTRIAAVHFCWTLHGRAALPVAALLEAGVHQHLTQLVVRSDNAEVVAIAGALLSALWQAQPSLVSEFVSQKHLPTLLKQAGGMVGSTAQNCLVILRLVQLVWSFTASLVSEPLLLQAIPSIVQCCGQVAAASNLTADDLQLQANLQEEAVALLCSMAEFPFYRPAIRKAEPAGALTSMLQAGCSPDDGQLQRTIAQLALNLVYKLLKGQTDESDGLDAPYNHSLLEGLILHRSAAMSVMRMCKHGILDGRHAALAVIKLFLLHRQRPVHMVAMQQGLISLGLMPLLFGIARAPDSTAEMRAMADACLASVHSEHNSCMAAYGTHGLIAKLIAISLHEQRAGTHPDKHGR